MSMSVLRKKENKRVCSYIRKSRQSFYLVDTMSDRHRIFDITLNRMDLRNRERGDRSDQLHLVQTRDLSC